MAKKLVLLPGAPTPDKLQAKLILETTLELSPGNYFDEDGVPLKTPLTLVEMANEERLALVNLEYDPFEMLGEYELAEKDGGADDEHVPLNPLWWRIVLVDEFGSIWSELIDVDEPTEEAGEPTK